MLRTALALLLLVLAIPSAFAQGDPRDKPNEDNPGAYAVGRFRQTAPQVKESLPFELRTDGPSNMAFLGLHDDWKGTFEPGGDDKPDTITLTRRPAADDINPEVPDWARRKVAGTLEWKLVIEVHECAADGFTLDATWYPGEITWTEGGGDARVSGPGNPVHITLLRQEDEPQEWETSPGRALLRVTPWDVPLATSSLPSVTLGRAFQVTARLSPQTAKSFGDHLPVTIANKRSGRSTTLQLDRYGGAQAHPVIYMAPERVVLGESHSGLESYIDLGLDNGDTVTVTAANSTTAFLYYKTWVQLGIAMHEREFDLLRKFYTQVVADPKQTFATKNDATVRLELINDVHAFMDHQAGPSEKFTDYTRYYVGERYLAMLKLPMSEWGRKYSPPGIDSYGVPWLFELEAQERARAIAEGNQAWNDAMWSLSKELTFGLYDFVASSTGADQFVAVVWGIDTRGNPIDMTDRLFAGLGLGSQLLLVGASVMHGMEAMQTSKLELEHQVAISEWQDKRLAGELPVSKRAGPSPALGAGSAPNFASVQAGKLDELNPDQPPFRRFKEGDPAFEAPTVSTPLNSRGTPLQLADNGCGVMTAEGMVVDAGFPGIPEQRAMEEAFNRGHWQPGLTELGGGPSEGGGMKVAGMQQYLEYYGAETDWHYKPQLSDLVRELGRGKKVALMVNSGTKLGDGLHWIRLEGVECGRNGRLYARIGDPWTGRSWRIRGDLLTRRTKHAVSADFSKVTMFVR